MGTRGAIGFRAKRKDRVQYNHSDSYPSWLGAEVLRFIQSSSLEELREIALRIELVEEQSKPTPKQIEECKPWTSLGVGSRSEDDWYCLLRDAQGDLGAYKEGLKYMIDSSSFLLDSLFCEYAYIINTDNNTLEFYKGFSQRPRVGKGRYALKCIRADEGRNQYYGVTLESKYQLEKIIGASDEDLAKIVQHMGKKSRNSGDD